MVRFATYSSNLLHSTSTTHKFCDQLTAKSQLTSNQEQTMNTLSRTIISGLTKKQSHLLQRKALFSSNPAVLRLKGVLQEVSEFLFLMQHNDVCLILHIPLTDNHYLSHSIFLVPKATLYSRNSYSFPERDNPNNGCRQGRIHHIQ